MATVREQLLGALQAEQDGLEAGPGEPPRGALYAVLDAARDARVPSLLEGSGEEHRSLYDGEEGQRLAEVAPYLVRFSPRSALLAPLCEAAAGESWGIFLVSARPFSEVRRHLRRFLMVAGRGGVEVYFRFYDPRVLRVFLPLVNAEQASRFHAGVERYLVEGPGPEPLLCFSAPEGTPLEGRPRPGLLEMTPAQLSAFVQADVDRFVARMVTHLRAFFPGAPEGQDEGLAREIVREGIRRAAAFGIVAERDVCLYVDLMVGFGRAFGDDEAWAAPVLRDPALSGTDRIERVHAAALALAEASPDA